MRALGISLMVVGLAGIADKRGNGTAERGGRRDGRLAAATPRRCYLREDGETASRVPQCPGFATSPPARVLSARTSGTNLGPSSTIQYVKMASARSRRSMVISFGFTFALCGAKGVNPDKAQESAAFRQRSGRIDIPRDRRRLCGPGLRVAGVTSAPSCSTAMVGECRLAAAPRGRRGEIRHHHRRRPAAPKRLLARSRRPRRIIVLYPS